MSGSTIDVSKKYTYVEASCHCNLNIFRVAFLTESLPIWSVLCNCNSCRHSSGEVALFHVEIVGRPLAVYKDEPAHLGGLKEYKSSAHTTRYFCVICGAHMLWKNNQNPAEPQYCVGGGVLHKIEGISGVDCHIFLEQTRDGGIADQLREREGVKLARYSKNRGSETLPLPWTSLSPEQIHKVPSPDERLSFYCHCHSMTFFITRPSEVSSIPHAPFPDLLKPYDVTHLTKIRNPKDEKWWLQPVGAEKPTKYFAGHCACASCRITSGFPIQSWVYVPRENIIDSATGNVIEMLGPNKPTGMTQYISSPGKYREFCSTCGATVFLWAVAIPGLINISAGLVDQDADGVRAERWFEWHKDRVSFSENVLARPTVTGLIEGLKASKIV